jgi:hypothetical protein
MEDKLGPKFVGHVLIRDKNTREVLVDRFNAINLEAMSVALAQSLADRSTGQIHEMDFGNGASTVSGTGAVTYFPPNVTGLTAALYNQTYRKVVDDMSPLNVNTADNYINVQHSAGTTFSDIVITCTLEANEPSGQLAFDNTTNTEGTYVFDELGIRSFAAIEGTGMLLTHVIFHPVQKSLNRVIEIVYTIRIFMS